ncbi:MAG: D-2-hydroxyacid dehydrogenase [Burkholderiales bacterium]
MPKVLVLLALPEKFRQYYKEELAREFPDVEFTHVDHVDKTDPHLADADVLVTFGPHLRERAAEVFGKMGKLKWVQAMGTGVDNIANIATLRPEVRLTNIHGIHGVPMSEATLAAMLALAREIPRLVNNQDARSWDRFAPILLDGKTAGIFGIGAIAETLAPRLKVMGMKVVGISSSPRSLPGFDEMRVRSDLVNAVRDLDFLILLTPHTDETHHIISTEVLAAMKPTSFIVNLARGGVVDEDALIKTLEAKKIGGAALDVFAIEPLPAESRLWGLKNVLISPHLGGFSQDSTRHTMPALLHNMRCFVEGKYDAMVNQVKRV